MKPLHLLRFALLLTLSLANLAGAQAAEQPKEVRIAIVASTVGDKPVFSGIPAVVEQRGRLTEALAHRGIALKWLAFPAESNAALTNEGFANGSVDFAVRGDLSSVISIANGIPTKVVVPGGLGSNLYLVVPYDSPAHSLSDLKGKRIAFQRGRVWELPFLRFVTSQGLSFDDFTIANLNPKVAAAGVAAGKVDAAVLAGEAWLLEDRKVGRIIWSSKEGPASWRLSSELWGSERFLDNNPELTQLVADAWLEATWWASQEENRQAYYELVSHMGNPISVLVRDDENDIVTWKNKWRPRSKDELISHYQGVEDYAVKARLIRSRPDVEHFIDLRFTEQALNNLGIQSYWKKSGQPLVKEQEPQ